MSRAIAQLERLEPRIALSAGGLDTSYGDGGRVTLFPNADFTVADETRINQLLPMSDGRLIVAGWLLNGPPYIERFLADGTLDSSFPVRNLEAQFAARGITSIGCAFTPDEKLLLRAARSSTPPYTPILLRLTHSGKIDRTFGHNGVARIPLESAGNTITLPDGRIVMTGAIHNDISEPNDDYTEAVDGIAVLKPNGKPDLRFGSNGVVETEHTFFLDDSLYPERQSIGAERIFPLSGGRFLYLRAANHSVAVWNDAIEEFIGSYQSGTIEAQVFNIDGSVDKTFRFDPGGMLAPLGAPEPQDSSFGAVFGGQFLADGASQRPDGSIQIALVVDTTPTDLSLDPDQHKASFNAYTATLGMDGTISDLKLLQTHYTTEHPSFFRQSDGELLLNDGSGAFKRYHADGSPDPSFVIDPSLNQQYTTLQGAVFSNDGQIIGSYIEVQYPDEKPFLAKVRTGVAPAGIFAGAPVRAPRSSSYRFTVTWHDADKIDAASLASPSAIVYGPVGTTRIATLLSLEPSGDATTIVATYRLAAPGGTWDAADNGVYSVRTRGRRIFDKAGHSTSARVLGRFAVAIA
jgi:uncharacterized delta-60 repeat protein